MSEILTIVHPARGEHYALLGGKKITPVVRTEIDLARELLHAGVRFHEYRCVGSVGENQPPYLFCWEKKA